MQNEEIVKKAIKDLQNSMKTNPKFYKAYLGKNYFDVNFIVENMVNKLNAFKSDFNTVREMSICNNFRKIYKHYPTGKYFGELGMEHVYQKNYDLYSSKNSKNFATFLNSSNKSPVKGKVLSIEYAYEDSFYMNVNYDNRSTQIPTVINDKLLSNYDKSDITLFKLNGENSPLNNTKHFIDDSSKGFTTEYFQYIISIKNSKATEPLGNI
ncbi:hypothetical protein [Clostridium felsineum]|uniref:hypothetical protein n=1 Tax=Clostridium felsineum TaxID=36839 RepID=UPI0011157534|nr:hypothetical protein [Clostridium felsineum]